MKEQRRAAYPGRVRIIAGRWRGRYIEVLDTPALRPTGNRIRETLFNWLAPVIEGARCLDLFAGTGACGFEAASRGAAEVVMIERDAARTRHLLALAARLGADRVQIRCADAFEWLQQTASAFDIVFLDPPFHERWIERCCAELDARGWLANGALVYIEAGARADMPQLPAGWRVQRERQAGQVRYLLAGPTQHNKDKR